MTWTSPKPRTSNLGKMRTPRGPQRDLLLQCTAMPFLVFTKGYRTGYPYRCPALCAKSKKNSSIDMPLALTGRSYSEINSPGTRSLPRIGGPSRRLSAGSSDGGPGSRVWNNVTRGHVKPLLRSLSSGVCVPSCMTTCLVRIFPLFTLSAIRCLLTFFYFSFIDSVACLFVPLTEHILLVFLWCFI